jgi:hypothetical protein
VIFTGIVLVPPAFAGFKWLAYLLTRRPFESVFPWGAGQVFEALGGGVAYFAVIVPFYFIWLARVRRYVSIARAGVLAVGIVEWDLVTYAKKPKQATLKINGTPIGGHLQFDDYWIPYRFEVGGASMTGLSPDGCGMFDKRYCVPAMRLPTGARVEVIYDPANPKRSLLTTALPRYAAFED